MRQRLITPDRASGNRFPDRSRRVTSNPMLRPVALLTAILPLALTAAESLPSVGLPRLARTNLLVYRDAAGNVQRVKSPQDWQQRRAEIVRGMERVMGVLPGNEKRCALDCKVEEETDCGSYVRRLRMEGTMMPTR